MLEYMSALHEGFFAEPAYPELRAEIEQTFQHLKQKADHGDRRRLLRLADLEAELCDKISLAGFTAGFRLAWGIAAKLARQPPYSFQRENERQAQRLSMEVV